MIYTIGNAPVKIIGTDFFTAPKGVVPTISIELTGLYEDGSGEIGKVIPSYPIAYLSADNGFDEIMTAIEKFKPEEKEKSNVL